MKAKIIFFALAVTGLFASCNEYYDDLAPLGQRVETLEDSIGNLDSKLQKLQTIIKVIQTHGYITRIEDNDDGSSTLYMMGDFDGSGNLTEKTILLENGHDGADGRNGADGQDGADGKNGKELEELLKAKEGDDGILYWIFNGQPLLDENGNPIPVAGPEGKKGEQGDKGDKGESKDSTNTIMPLVRIGPNGTWEISTNGGKTWDDTHVKAKGEKGDKGDKGDEGDPAPVDMSFKMSDDGTHVIFYVYYDNGEVETYVVPRNSIE
jgi:hypothetical protein